MPYPPLREATLYPTVAGGFSVSAPTANDSTEAVGGSNGSRSWTLTPGAAATVESLPNTWHNTGWMISGADFIPTDTRGRTRLAPGSVTFDLRMDSVNDQVTLGTATCAPAVSLWRVTASAPNDGNHVLIAYQQASAQSVGAPAVGGGGTVTVSVTVSEVLFDRDETLFVQIGGTFTSPNGTVFANVTDFTVSVESRTFMGLTSPGLRVFLEDAASGVGDASGVKTLMTGKISDGTSVASGLASRQGVFFRSGVSTSTSASELSKAMAKSVPSTAHVSGSELLLASKNSMSYSSASGLETTKTSKSKNADATAQGSGERLLIATRDAQGSATGQGDASRIVIYAREALSTAIGSITPRDVRICVPVSSLIEGGGGGGTTIINRPVFVFED